MFPWTSELTVWLRPLLFCSLMWCLSPPVCVCVRFPSVFLCRCMLNPRVCDSSMVYCDGRLLAHLSFPTVWNGKHQSKWHTDSTPYRYTEDNTQRHVWVSVHCLLVLLPWKAVRVSVLSRPSLQRATSQVFFLFVGVRYFCVRVIAPPLLVLPCAPAPKVLLFNVSLWMKMSELY